MPLYPTETAPEKSLPENIAARPSSPRTCFTQPCPHCERLQQIPVHYLGSQMTCRHCGRAFLATDRPALSPDEGLRRRITNFLHDRQIPGLDSVEVHVSGGVVTLLGRLPSRRAKWLCLECCQRVAGVIRIVDRLEARPPRRPEIQEPPSDRSRFSPRKPR